MRNSRVAAALLATGVLALGVAGGTAGAAPEKKPGSGQVLVFIADVAVPVEKFESPEGCYKLPLGTHVVINDTDEKIELYASPDCGAVVPAPGIPLEAGYGAHELPAFGSFKA